MTTDIPALRSLRTTSLLAARTNVNFSGSIFHERARRRT
jgi:hypothetical protein